MNSATAISTEWQAATKFPQTAGVYEVRGAPQGKGSFYFDGWHWHLHHKSQAEHLDLRTYGCPGTHWRSV